MQALPLLVSRALTESSQLNYTTDGSSATPSDSATADSSESGPEDVDIQSAAALAVLIQIFLIGASLLIGRLLERYNVTWMSEASAALLIGMVSGVLAWHFSTSATFKNWMKFQVMSLGEELVGNGMQPEFFFLGLLPPIIFEAGYSLDVKPFFSNIGAICMFAFFGTTVSTFCIGFVMWVFGLMGAVYSMSLLENLVFGAIVSATDPVTVLAVFQRLRADENLYSLVFGESVLNDAVAIVLYNTLLIYTKQSVTVASLFWGMGVFFAVFVGSMLTGIFFGVVAALLFKTGWLRGSHAPLESAFVVVLAYSSYYTAECMALSPIVSILFCGMFMAKYARPNLSSRGNSRSGAFFQMFAHLAETFVFLYIGATLFLDEQSWHRGRMWSYLAVALLALGASRALHVLPSSALVNLLRPREQRIPQSHQFMLWFSGLRGAIAFALALQASRDLPDPQAARVLLTCTFFIVLLTVLFNGGAATFLLNRLQLRTDPGDGSGNAEQQRLWPVGSSSDCLLHTAAESMLSPAASGTLSSQHTPSASATPTSTLKSPRYLDKVIEFNRTGGLAARFQPLDRVLTQVLTRDRSPSQDALELTSAAPQTPVRQPLPTPSAPDSLHQADPEEGANAMLGASEGGGPTPPASGDEANLCSPAPL